MDLRIVVDFSEYVAFYLLLGWSNNLQAPCMWNWKPEFHPVGLRLPRLLQFSSVQSFSRVLRLFVTPWTEARQASLFFTISWSLLKLMSIESMMPFNHLILCLPLFSCPKSFPALESFPVSQFFASGSQSTGALASVLPMDIQD